MADLSKPSNVATNGVIQATDVGALYDVLLGTSSYDNLKVNNVKKWVGLLTQSGTNAPTATVLYNTLGGTIVFARTGEGTYSATLAGAFTSSKTIGMMFLGQVSPNVYHAYAFRFSDNVMVITTLDENHTAADAFSGAVLIINVYP